jgi:hypothetical protein
MPKSRIRNTILVNGKRKVCRIWDNGGETLDRYTVAYKARREYGMLFWPYLAADEHPFSPQGFGQHGEMSQFITGKHLGKRIRFDDLPPDVQKFILQEI